ncbi:hypothetical protein HYH02_005943 [Chlamydomonas schloesseri]|uniref:Uncharacterized protein n=1 Tax=Chlamydomonas schloesseri TaxID=2026947 RepID=A0A836B6L7_9CHLO|nr:hypothetical protein HYH02_005943 [Chlamydomonas schloesseri]|eukprot:KAG2449196.1 hypothetical protein HYH02_005943 [Chlamydomonas schloesseri]
MGSRESSVTKGKSAGHSDTLSAAGSSSSSSSKGLSAASTQNPGGGKQQARSFATITARSGGMTRALRSGIRRTAAQLLNGLFVSGGATAAGSSASRAADALGHKLSTTHGQPAVVLSTVPHAQKGDQPAHMHSAPLWHLPPQPTAGMPAAGSLARISAAAAAPASAETAAVPAAQDGMTRRRAESLHLPRGEAQAAAPLRGPYMPSVSSTRTLVRAASGSLELNMAVTVLGTGASAPTAGGMVNSGMRKIASQPDLQMLSASAAYLQQQEPYTAGGRVQQRLMLSTGMLQPLDEMSALDDDARAGSSMSPGAAFRSTSGTAAALFMTTADGAGLYRSPVGGAAGALSSSACGVQGLTATCCSLCSGPQHLGSSSTSQPLRLQSVHLLDQQTASSYQHQASWAQETSAQLLAKSSSLMRCEAVDEDALGSTAGHDASIQESGTAVAIWAGASAPLPKVYAANAAAGAADASTAMPPLPRAVTASSGRGGALRRSLDYLLLRSSTGGFGAKHVRIAEQQVVLPTAGCEMGAGSTAVSGAGRCKGAAPDRHYKQPVGAMRKVMKAVRKVVGKSSAS